MPTFTIERSYLVPVYKHITLDAETPEMALAIGMNEDFHDWEGQKVDYESARANYCSGFWEGDRDHHGTELPIPAEFADTGRPGSEEGEAKADPAPIATATVRRLVNAAATVCRAYGGTIPDWLQTEIDELPLARDAAAALIDEDSAPVSLYFVNDPESHDYDLFVLAADDERARALWFAHWEFDAEEPDEAPGCRVFLFGPPVAGAERVVEWHSPDLRIVTPAPDSQESVR